MEDKKLDKLLKKTKTVNSNKELIKPHTNQEFVTKPERDPNSIIVDIRSKKPVVIFYGPRSIGKTVALIRLSKFLKTERYKIEPDKNFRKDDVDYQKLCNSFQADYLDNPIAPSSTAAINFLLLKVSNSKGVFCQLLEAPGEHYFDAAKINSEYPPYLETILSSNIPKVYVFFLEIGWGIRSEKEGYEKKIVDFIPRIKQSDHIVLLCNKADRNPDFMYNGKPQKREFRNSIEEEYSKIFDKLGRKGMFKLFSPEVHDYDFVVFSAGSFIDRANGSGQTYTKGDDYYPKQLWQAIKSGIRGKWY